MLVLPIRTLGDVIAFDDDATAGAVCVALARPRAARRPDGSSRVRLVHWVSQSGGDAAKAGGRLMVDVEVAPTRDELTTAGLVGRDTRPVPWLDAKVRLEGPQFDPVEADVSCVPGATAVLAVDLPPPAAALLAPLLQASTVSPLQVTWTGHVLVRLPAVEVVATADLNEVRRRIALATGAGTAAVTRAILDANARVEIRAGTNEALEAALRDWALGELATRFEKGESLAVSAAASDVVRWPVVLATTLDDFVPPATRASLVDTVVLDDEELGRTPPIQVRVLADFSGTLERVDVRLNPATEDQIVHVSVCSDAPASTSLRTPELRWSSRVKMKGRPAGDWSGWHEARGRSAILVPIAVPSALRVEVYGAGLDFATRWSSVTVSLTHTVAGSSTSGTVLLTGQQASASWSIPLDGERGSLQARLTYLSRLGQSVERLIDDVSGDQVVVTDPFEGNCARFVLLPAGTGWGDVALAMVDLRYADGACTIDETVELRTLQDLVEWIVPARPEGPRTAQWRLHASFADGRYQSGDWQPAESGVTIVRIDGVPRRTVQILAVFFDSTRTKSGVLRLRSGSQIQTLTITDRTPRTATLGSGPFTWTMQWTLADGIQQAESSPRDGDDVIVVPRFDS